MQVARAATLVGLSVGVSLAACSNTSTGSSGAPRSCGLSLAWETNASVCDGWMSYRCCSQEQACAADTACAAYVKCVNDCPIPRKDACTGACGSRPTGV